MKTKKLIILGLILSFSIPNVNALEVDGLNKNLPVTSKTTHYNDYIYFLQDYNQLEGPYGVSREYKNKGYYRRPIIGYYNGTPTIVELRRKKSDCAGRSDCQSLEDFYKKIDSLTNTSEIDKKTIPIDDKVCTLDYSSQESMTIGTGEKTIDEFFYHGCYSTYNDTTRSFGPIVSSGRTINTKFSEYINGMICSSVYRDKNNIDVNVSITDKYAAFEITRKPLNVYKSGVTLTSPLPNKCTSSDYNVLDAFDYNYGLGSEEKLEFFRSPVLVKYSYDRDTHNCSETPNEKIGSCDEETYISQKCSRKTIENSNNLGNVEISQTARVIPHIEQNEIHQGGGINVGFTYYNEIEWTFDENSLISTEGNSKTRIKEILSNIIKNNYISNENYVNIDFNVDGMQYDLYLKKIKELMNINKKCNRQFLDNKVITTCTFTPQEAELKKYIGAIDLNKFNTSVDINNNLYTDLNYNGKYSVSATFTNINMLRDNTFEGDNSWTIKVQNKNNSDNSCDVEVKGRLYEEANGGGTPLSTELKPIYRPIDLNNPFPNNRPVGSNWKEWYENHPNELKESFTKLQYQIELRPDVIKQIKDTTTDYSDWSGIKDNKESVFVEKWFDPSKSSYNIIRDNLPRGDTE